MILQGEQSLRAIAWIALKRWLRIQFPAVPRLSTADLATWLQDPATEKPFLLDVRTSAEYGVSHLERAHLAPLHLQDLSQWAGVTLSTPIVAYCSVGYRSARLVQQLQYLGYEKVWNLEGSIFQWVNEGRQVYQRDQIVRQVHPYNETWGTLIDPTYPQVI